MAKTQNTKRALLSSVLALVVCIAMLVGSTFAWFTDSASTSGNTIVSGNLDVALEMYDEANKEWVNAEGKTLNWVTTDSGEVLWEPGCTYKLPQLRVVNNGNLALKYQVVISGLEGDAELLDVIEFTGIPAEDQYVELKEKGDSEEFQIIGHMLETAGNKYMNKTLSGITITVNATQLNYENDSYGPDYDKDAWHPDMRVTTAEELAKVLKNAKDGDVIGFAADITSTDGLVITDKNLTFDLNGNTYTVSEGASTNSRNFKINGTSNVTIKNGTLIAKGDASSGTYGTVRTEGTANVTLENMKLYNYRGNGLNIKALSGTTVTVKDSEIYSENGGGVEAAGGTIVLYDTDITQSGAYDYCSAAIGVNGSGKVVVNSGTYTANTTGTWVAFVMNSGGTLEINGGDFAGVNASGIICADRAAVVNINGGNFDSTGAILNMCNNTGTLPNPVATLAGGTFSADPRVSGGWNGGISVADGYTVVTSGTVYHVVPVEAGVTLTATAHAGIYKGTAKNYYVFDKTGLMNLNALFAEIAPNEGNINTVNLIADVDLAGEDWVPLTSMWIIFNGNGHTIKNLNASGMDATGRRSGFWGYAGAVTINDLTLENATVNGSQAGIFAGAAEGLKINNCFLKGNNTVNYVDGVEDWNGIGAISGVVQNSTMNVTIVDGATVTLNKTGFTTASDCAYVDDLTGYISANLGTVVNNGQINVIS